MCNSTKTTFDRIKELCEQDGISIAKLAAQLNISKSTFSWIKNYPNKKISLDTAAKIANYFGVSVNYLITGEDLNYCSYCGFSDADSLNKEKIKFHQELHDKIDVIKAREGFYYPVRLRERLKGEARGVIHESNDPKEIEKAWITVFECLYSRSISANDFDTKHPSLGQYIAMLLFNRDIDISQPMYDLFVGKYGKLPGIKKGSTYYIVEEKATPKKPKVTVDDLKIALFDGAKDVTDEMWEEAKEFARFIMERERKKNDNKQ